MRGSGFLWWCRPEAVAGSVLRLPWLRQALALLRRAFAEFRADHCPQMAAAISYRVLFSVFPLAIMAVGIIGLVTQDPHARDAVTAAVVKVVPLSSHGRQQPRGLLGSVSGGAGALGLLGLIGVIWSSSGVMAAVRTALNVAWDTDARRPFLRGKAVDLTLVADIFLVTGATLGLTVAASIIRRGDARLPDALRGLEPLAEAGAWLAVVAASTALLFANFAFLYRFVPAVPTRMGGIWPGAPAAAAGFEALQYGFSAYLAFFGHYNKVYGSLGAVVAFMFFIYLASMVFLFGAEIASGYPRLHDGATDAEGSGSPACRPIPGCSSTSTTTHSTPAGTAWTTWAWIRPRRNPSSACCAPSTACSRTARRPPGFPPSSRTSPVTRCATPGRTCRGCTTPHPFTPPPRENWPSPSPTSTSSAPAPSRPSSHHRRSRPSPSPPRRSSHSRPRTCPPHVVLGGSRRGRRRPARCQWTVRRRHCPFGAMMVNLPIGFALAAARPAVYAYATYAYATQSTEGPLRARHRATRRYCRSCGCGKTSCRPNPETLPRSPLHAADVAGVNSAIPPSEDPKLGDPGTTRDDHEQYAEDRGEQGRHAQRHVAIGAQALNGLVRAGRQCSLCRGRRPRKPDRS